MFPLSIVLLPEYHSISNLKFVKTFLDIGGIQLKNQKKACMPVGFRHYLNVPVI